MEALCLDILNSTWRGYRGGEREQDRLLTPGWDEQLMKRWGIQALSPLEPEAREVLQTLRSAMSHVIEAIEKGTDPAEQDLETINTALALMPSTPFLAREENQYVLSYHPLQVDWRWFVREVAFSFTQLLIQHDPLRLKRCQNPACGWSFYDESRHKNRQWCNQTCATLMRVRRFRLHHRSLSSEQFTP
ncbi:CGNR zinc finger domain-containing protein [Reticulibacter mediterranei]|nr:CGNR zinc finger domain-containing protein [Reticulibacter mediterranei]